MFSQEALKPNCCDIRRQLADEFAIAARLFAEAVVLFTRRDDTRSNDEYNRLCTISRRAQQRAEIARIAFEKHVASHGCR